MNDINREMNIEELDNVSGGMYLGMVNKGGLGLGMDPIFKSGDVVNVLSKNNQERGVVESVTDKGGSFVYNIRFGNGATMIANETDLARVVI